MAAGIATRGKRVALPPAQPPSAEGGAPVYVVHNRPLKFGGHTLPKGTEVPGAADWTRVEAWVNARQIHRLQPGEDYVTYEAFAGMTWEDEQAAAEVERIEAELEQEQTEPEE